MPRVLGVAARLVLVPFALAPLALAPPAMAQGSAAFAADENVAFAYADVLRVDPVYEIVRFREPREECYDRPVVYRERGSDGTAGAIVGAIVGGALGNQVGKGDGRRAATVAGAAIGGAVGANSDRRPDREYESVETRCRVTEVEREERRTAGYDVEYRYKDDVFFSRLAYDPGNRLRIRVAVRPAD
jgi:uncharacterized protein YcfJ